MRDAEVSAAAQLACLLEVSAPKPGNVSPGRHFGDVRYEDFLASAAAIGTAFAGAGERPLGSTIRRAIEETARWTRTNTNLGIVLLLAPLAKGAMQTGECWRSAVRRVLAETTVEDARDVYAAIRLARPGGLGRVETEDVSEEPTRPLLDVMRLAADRDRIAREYATSFDVTFDTAVPALQRARAEGLSWDDAVVETFMTILAASPDTHVVRRAGAERAGAITAGAQAIVARGGVRSEAGRRAIAELDTMLRDARHLGNPGTAADLTAAAIFVTLLDDRRTSGGGDHAAAR